MDTITGRVISTERHGHTIYGNPMISLTLAPIFASDGYTETYRISNDASLVYAIENSEYRNKPHTFALTRAGRISHEVR
jgi:hypothetical protein